MKSPFPGMDPYIEACGLWEGFHDRLIARIDEALSQMLPPGYTTDIGARSYVVLVEAEGKAKRLAKPDVTLTESAGRKKPARKKGGVAVAACPGVAEPVRMRPFVAEKFRETFVEIYAQVPERTLVTCIEVLSPTNKRKETEGWHEYLRKRQAMLLGQANFIEIDLLRGGERMPMLDPWPDSPYTLLVCRAMDAPDCCVWPADFRERVPPIPVPLASPDPDLMLDLQPLVDTIYSLGRYADLIDYERRLTPPLPAADVAWVRERLRARPPRT